MRKAKLEMVAEMLGFEKDMFFTSSGRISRDGAIALETAVHRLLFKIQQEGIEDPALEEIDYRVVPVDNEGQQILEAFRDNTNKSGARGESG